MVEPRLTPLTACMAALLVAGCLGGGGAATPTPTEPAAVPTPTQTPTPTPTPSEWDLATEAGGVVFEGEVGHATKYFRVGSQATVTVRVRGDGSQRVQLAYAPEGQAPEIVDLRGGETYRFDVTAGAWGLEVGGVGDPVAVTVRVGG